MKALSSFPGNTTLSHRALMNKMQGVILYLSSQFLTWHLLSVIVNNKGLYHDEL